VTWIVILLKEDGTLVISLHLLNALNMMWEDVLGVVLLRYGVALWLNFRIWLLLSLPLFDILLMLCIRLGLTLSRPGLIMLLDFCWLAWVILNNKVKAACNQVNRP
jgi:hypothetical protein